MRRFFFASGLTSFGLHEDAGRVVNMEGAHQAQRGFRLRLAGHPAEICEHMESFVAEGFRDRVSEPPKLRDEGCPRSPRITERLSPNSLEMQ